jgi:tetratricopeptide (TPR) repeat protein
MNSIESLLEPFIGYLHLGMFLDANDELEKLPPELKTHPKVLTARLVLLMEMRKWEDGALLGESLIKLWPSEHEFHFKKAYCLHELKRTQEAKQTLESAPMSIRDTALFFYNLACYEAQLDNLVRANALLKECFKKEPYYRQESLDDPDLEPLWDSLGKT